MARPMKKGLEYFSLDVDMDQDDKIALIESQHGLVGFSIIIKLLMKIYSNGYYYEWGEKELLLFSKRVNVDNNTCSEIVNDCIKWGIFDKSIFEKDGVLTSRGIQKRFLLAVGRRQRVEIKGKYLLLSNEDINVYKNLVIVDDNNRSVEVNVDIGTQSKVNRNRKEIESKEKVKEIESKLTDDENNFIEVLKSIENYPLDIESDVKLYKDLSEKFPQLDILQAINKFAVYKQDKPLTVNSNSKSQINTSFEKYVEWGECLKTPTPPIKKREVWV